MPHVPAPALALALALLLSAAGSGAAESPAGGLRADAPDDNRAYVGEAAKRPGAVQTASGLVYIEVQRGVGPAPGPRSRVRVHYRGTLIDGLEFDSSLARKKPAEFRLDEVIPCWTEGLQMMREGGRATLVCPAATAYGSMGSPPIPANATLVFEVELIKITRP